MCYSGKCNYEDHMGNCRNIDIGSGCPNFQEFEEYIELTHKMIHIDQNIANNVTAVSVGRLTVYFSYRMPVAFRISKQNIVVREELWGSTTREQINAIVYNKDYDPIEKEAFKEQLRAAFDRNAIEMAQNVAMERLNVIEKDNQQS